LSLYLIIAIGLSADCFAVALSSAIASKHTTFARFFRLPLAFGIFQALMVVLGWLAGRAVIDFISAYDHWLAFALLIFIGGRMIWESFREKSGDKTRNYDGWLTLIVLSIATSIDALAVGLSFGFMGTDIVLASAVIGIIAFIVTIIGQLIGKWVGILAGKWAEIIGGLILIGIGVKILLEHML
jgi:putative Mn2+ efflux pump MntP